MLNRTTRITSAAALLAAATASHAAVYTIDWLDMGPTLFGTPVPNNSNYFLPGVGNVNITYSLSPNFNHARQDTTATNLINGSVTSGPDTYNWGAHEQFAATLLVGPDPLVPESWRITYTFPNAIPAGNLFLGVSGLGATTSFGGGTSTATVNQSGTFLGDWSGGNNWGQTLFSGGVGSFSMQNSLTGIGGVDPHWNSQLGVVRIDDTITSLTIDFAQIRGDGVGVNIGYVPTPGTAALFGLGSFACLRRRR